MSIYPKLCWFIQIFCRFSPIMAIYPKLWGFLPNYGDFSQIVSIHPKFVLNYPKIDTKDQTGDKFKIWRKSIHKIWRTNSLIQNFKLRLVLQLTTMEPQKFILVIQSKIINSWPKSRHDKMRLTAIFRFRFRKEQIVRRVIFDLAKIPLQTDIRKMTIIYARKLENFLSRNHRLFFVYN